MCVFDATWQSELVSNVPQLAEAQRSVADSAEEFEFVGKTFRIVGSQGDQFDVTVEGRRRVVVAADAERLSVDTESDGDADVEDVDGVGIDVEYAEIDLVVDGGAGESVAAIPSASEAVGSSSEVAELVSDRETWYYSSPARNKC